VLQYVIKVATESALDRKELDTALAPEHCRHDFSSTTISLSLTVKNIRIYPRIFCGDFPHLNKTGSVYVCIHKLIEWPMPTLPVFFYSVCTCLSMHFIMFPRAS